jgi:predicted nucleotidyltransferase
MDISSVTQILKDHHTELSQKVVKSLAIFGSVARGDATENSDIDILVEFNKSIGLFEFIRLKKYLEEMTGCRVDLVTPDALHPALRNSILAEAIYVT